MVAASIALDFANVNAVQALHWTAAINGVLAPFLLTGILPSSRLGRIAVTGTTVAMFAGAAGTNLL